MQLWNWIASKTNSTGRLVLMAVLGGVLVAAMAIPVVAATGILVRNTADGFTTRSGSTSSLPQRSAIYDSSGHLITYVYSLDMGTNAKYTGVNRQPVSYDQISKNMTTAIVAIEDDRFWQHGALDVKGTLRALVNNLEHKPVQGGSTLEQQYVKNVLILQSLNDPVAQAAAVADTLNRKFEQLRMAVQVAHSMSKEQILAGYLNDSYYGSGAWGVEAAAETYFNTTAAKLTMTQAATLAGIVENPTAYDPLTNPVTSTSRRNTVLARITQTNVQALSAADAARLEQSKLLLHAGSIPNGCMEATNSDAGFFCDYVMHTLVNDSQLGSSAQARTRLIATGGLKIYTTLSETDQRSATKAVNYVLPYGSRVYNPAGNAAAEVLIQPGTGKILAIAEDRQYGNGGGGQTTIDYSVNQQYGGGSGVQTGSSAKLFTLITALEQGIPFGYQQTVPGVQTVTGYTNCNGNGTSPFPVSNAEGPGTSTDSLYTGTTNSINVFFAHLEQKVGLCNTVKTAVNLGVTRVDGSSLLQNEGCNSKGQCAQYSADNFPSFTLGTVNVSPMSMAAAYAVPASGGTYCAPVALTTIVNASGQQLPVPSAGCHRVIPQSVAEGVNYILQGVLTSGTAAGLELSGYQAAGKTGTSNVVSGNGTPYAAFAGYTNALVGYVSVFNPNGPTKYTMTGQSACFQLEGGGQDCPSEMYGANAPASTWHMTFDHANLSGSTAFTPVPSGSSLWSQGDGTTVKQPATKKSKGGQRGGNGGGGNGGGGNGGNGGGGGGNGGGGDGGNGGGGNGNGNGNGKTG